MKKQLADIDPIYNEVISILSKQSRLKYCEFLIDKVQSYIINNKKYIGEKLIEQWKETIIAAQNEIQKINLKNEE